MLMEVCKKWDVKCRHFKVFKVIINEFGTIKSILKNRMHELVNAIETKDPSRLGKCRYYGNCQFGNSDSCSCKNLKLIDTIPLQRSLEVNFDKEFTDKLEKIKNVSQKSNYSLFTTYEIIAPRKRYMKTILNIEEKSDTDKYKICLEASVKSFQNKYDMGLNKSQRQEVLASQRETKAWIGFRWMNLKSSIHPKGQIVPYLLKVSKLSNGSYANAPSDYHIAELGIVCASYGKSKGLIFILYPNLYGLVKVFQITYKNISSIIKIIGENIDRIENAEKNQDLLSLPPCPSFMNENGKCPLIKECNLVKGKGCTS